MNYESGIMKSQEATEIRLNIFRALVITLIVFDILLLLIRFSEGPLLYIHFLYGIVAPPLFIFFVAIFILAVIVLFGVFRNKNLSKIKKIIFLLLAFGSMLLVLNLINFFFINYSGLST